MSEWSDSPCWNREGNTTVPIIGPTTALTIARMATGSDEARKTGLFLELAASTCCVVDGIRSDPDHCADGAVTF
jgi:hypothetical protein